MEKTVAGMEAIVADMDRREAALAKRKEDVDVIDDASKKMFEYCRNLEGEYCTPARDSLQTSNKILLDASSMTSTSCLRFASEASRLSMSGVGKAQA